MSQQPNEPLEGEIVEGLPHVPYELDGEKKLALIGLNAEQMVYVAHGLHLLVNALKHEIPSTAELAKVAGLFHAMSGIAEEVRAL